jgi:hypothetical protein
MCDVTNAAAEFIVSPAFCSVCTQFIAEIVKEFTAEIVKREAKLETRIILDCTPTSGHASRQ